MWIYNNDFNKWYSTDDKLSLDNFNYLKQELSSTRFYSKCLSGATYLPINNTFNIYDILGEYEPRNWYVSILGSSYSNSLIPSQHAMPITKQTSYDYYTKYLGEYGLTLKNHFTPNRIIKESVKNYIEVDVATTESIDVNGNFVDFVIDGVLLKNGHRVLVKDQKTNTVLNSEFDPNDYFKGNYYIFRDLGATTEYTYYNEVNDIYVYNNNRLTKQTELNDYNNCVRFSVLVKMGNLNAEKQFHLSRLLNGYYPTSTYSEPMEFIERKNWLLRNRMDYNNLFEINYYDVIKHGEQSYNIDGITYSIPERVISVGEFGIILNTQNGVSNIIPNKYKVNLRGIAETTIYYWICGDDGTLLRVRKHDFTVDKILVDCSCPRNIITTSLKSISFFNDLKGVAVGQLNTILVTENGGQKWERLRILDFDAFNFNKTIYSTLDSFYVVGDNGVFIEIEEDISGWNAYRRRISRYIDDDDEYLLVDNINNIYQTSIDTWGLSFSYSTQSTLTTKDLLFMVADDSKIIVYDISDSIPEFDFVYLDFPKNYGDITNITQRQGTNTFYFTGNDYSTSNGTPCIFSFDINNFNYIGVGNSYSNSISGLAAATIEYTDIYPNAIFDYDGTEMVVCGNTSLLKSSTYSVLNFNILDPTFEDKLHPKLLFLDYDIGSKLNFFTDDGTYRLPNSLTFSSASFSVGSYLSFNPIVYPSKTETNWITYWTDRSKTFEFYNTYLPLDESSKVLISTTFSYTGITSSVSISTISNATWSIYNLAPNILDNEASRFNGVGFTPISAPTASYDIYIYDYLMVYKSSIGGFSASVGDVIKLESSILDSDLVINKIVNIGSDQYIYMFNDFNDNIITNLSITTYSVTLTNLNKYSTVDELSDRFNLHPISNAYEFTYSTSSNITEITPLFNNLTAYYNLATNVILSGDYKTMSYTSGFMNFGYSPTYNLLDYFERLNDQFSITPLFYGDKDFLAMPEYIGIPLQGINSFTSSTAYIDYNGMTYSNTTGNKIKFGSKLKLEWESLFINTFVDISLYSSSTYTYGLSASNTERLLIMKKYYDSVEDAYIIEFHKKMNFTLGQFLYFIDIKSRRKLEQISEDLQELNNIQTSKLRSVEIAQGSEFYSYERELNFKIPTDSYAKILLSDSDVVQTLSSIIYIDYKNELSVNITRLGKDYNVPIRNTSNFSGNLYISCSEKHDLSTGDGVVLEFNGGTGSSQELNQQYFGYHPVIVVNELDFYLDIPYGNIPLVGNDSGFVKYSRKDPFLNYQPVDIIDVGIDKKGKISIELSIDNLELSNGQFNLINVDYGKYRYRLIDGLNVDILSSQYSWILEAEISDAILGLDTNGLVWYKGSWECGRWFGGTWISGSWKSGDWYGGIWNSKMIKDNLISVEVDQKSSDNIQSTWFGGRWYTGTWNSGLWVDGRWYDGIWNDGLWYKGIWNDGTWNNGTFTGGIWVLGTWNKGIFNTDSEPAYWLDGKWHGGDFENGMWYNGQFDQKMYKSRFGVKAYNSRTATWHGGVWVGGEFHSKMNMNDAGKLDVSDVHKYSIWYTGSWFSGNWYGGIAYNMDFKSGTWHGGILEDIQIIGMNDSGNYFVLNGIFKFNIGDEITIIDNQIGGAYSTYGSNILPVKYKVLYTVEDSVNKWTNVYVDHNISDDVSAPADTQIRVVSRFRSANWKSGIWTNGIYESGHFEGGIWYNGIFSGTWM
jgi:hypothetical protein